VTSLREHAQAFLSQFLKFVVDLRKAFLHKNSFNLLCIAPDIQLEFTMSSESLEMETTFNSDDSEINFITGYEVEDEGHSFRVSPRSPKTSSDSNDDDDNAYADEPLADAEWLGRYQEEMKANEELERSLKDRLQGKVERKEW